jgi:3-hydroxyacyl-[acyl-carrier-protein] dehydratase
MNSPTSSETILQAIPHRPPMLLVDEIIEQTGNKIHCQKTFRTDEYFVQGHYPGHPLVPGVILCECAAQTGAILLSSLVSAENAVPVLTRMNDVKFKQMVHPGDTVDILVTLDEVVANAYFLTGQVKLAGKMAARLGFACSVTPRQDARDS